MVSPTKNVHYTWIYLLRGRELCLLCVRAAAWAAGCLESEVKPLCQIFFFVCIKQGCLKSKDNFLRVAVPSYSVPIRQKKGRWKHQPKGNYLIINHKIKSDVAIGQKKGHWEHIENTYSLTVNYLNKTRCFHRTEKGPMGTPAKR